MSRLPFSGLILWIAVIAAACAALPGPAACGAPSSGAPEDGAPPDGRWREVAPYDGFGQQALTEEQIEEMERLRSIGYLTGSRPPGLVTGVTIYDPSRAFEGLNFYTSGHFPGAVLMDMNGKVLHTWERSFSDVWPDKQADAVSENAQYWRYAHLFDNGDVLAIFEGYGLVKLDKDSNVLWSHYGGEHHDLKVLGDGTICVLTRHPSLDPRIDPEHPVMEDFVTFLTSDGKEIRSISILQALARSRYARLLQGRQPWGDVLHTNAVDVLDGKLSGVHRALRPGNVLVSMRTLSILAVVDMDTGLIDWALAGSWRMQHDPSVLDNGRILMFDNNGNEDMSRVIEVDPADGGVTWEYKPENPNDFYSQMCGAAQRLPNGNTLATESDAGRVIEITHDRDIVWEYRNPERAGENDQFVATLFEMTRLSPDFPIGWLRK
jgi:hypothetical protein